MIVIFKYYNMSDDNRKKIICILPICCYPTNNDSNGGAERMRQYVEGLCKFFEYNDILKNHNIDIYIVDNSIKDGGTLPQEILNVIPEHVKTILFLKNDFGKLNKGAGLIEQWLYCKNILINYDWLIHFEPRQLLLNFNFINNFLKKPRNLFTYGNGKKHFNTGLFCIETSALLNYIVKVDLNNMVSCSISIEYDLYNYTVRNSIDFYILEKIELIWFDFIAKRECLF